MIYFVVNILFDQIINQCFSYKSLTFLNKKIELRENQNYVYTLFSYKAMN